MEIDKRILNDSEYLKDLELCQLRLYKDGDLNWFILVPMRENVIDWCDLSIKEQHLLTEEIDYCCRLLRKYVGPDKINVASLGNMVAQMHVHIIARYYDDRAWPKPIFGTASKKTYQSYMLETWIKRLQ
jgi:diadenosine tetraphosphate (Ap4A) HIT family hydrolase